MKKILFILLLLIPLVAFAENRFDAGSWGAYEHTTGGDDAALDGVVNPQDGDVKFVFGTIDGFFVWAPYVFDSSCTETESGQTYIAPDDATAGRWVQGQPMFMFGTAGDLSGVTDQAGVVKWETE